MSEMAKQCSNRNAGVELTNVKFVNLIRVENT